METRTETTTVETALTKLMASLVLEAAETREHSFDGAGADNASKKAHKKFEKQKEDNPGKLILPPFVDYKKFYGLTLNEACVLVCKKRGVPAMAQLIDNMLYTMWNDAIAWAEDILNRKFVEKAVKGDMNV